MNSQQQQQMKTVVLVLTLSQQQSGYDDGCDDCVPPHLLLETGLIPPKFNK
jgi:hypothetical protein